jgi:hypothetical protein
VSAGLITGLFNSGVDAQGALLSDVAIDPHYRVSVLVPGQVASPDAFLAISNQFPIGPWLANGPASKWIQPDIRSISNALILNNDPNAAVLDVIYIYRTTFSIDPHADLSSIVIRGQFAADNGASIELNGVATGISTPYPLGFKAFTSFTLTQGFKSGINELTFVVRNMKQVGGNPTGLRVEFSSLTATSANVVPEPMSCVAVLGLCGTLAVFRGRRRL